VKNRLLSGVLAVTGILALSATVAHAGGTGNPVALTSFFTCHQVNGVSLGTVVDVYSNEVGPGGVPAPGTASRTNVTIGQAILACAQTFLFKAGVVPQVDDNGNPTNNISPQLPPRGDPSVSPETHELKCYTASVSKKSGDSGPLTLEDSLFDDAFGTPEVPIRTETLTVLRDPKLICAPAFKPLQ
jgi:hypothetical protein